MALNKSVTVAILCQCKRCHCNQGCLYSPNLIEPLLCLFPPSLLSSQWKMQKGGENGIKDGEDLIFLQSKMEFLGVERETEKGGEKERAEKRQCQRSA